MPTTWTEAVLSQHSFGLSQVCTCFMKEARDFRGVCAREYSTCAISSSTGRRTAAKKRPGFTLRPLLDAGLSVEQSAPVHRHYDNTGKCGNWDRSGRARSRYPTRGALCNARPSQGRRNPLHQLVSHPAAKVAQTTGLAHDQRFLEGVLECASGA